ncbi:hypothetical protein L9F63_025984 [Diploptera punctata]|uniref:Glucuronosyltransferase n=1 Tax=Diploptera punctata TaxID=6984 RepID=A0AAD7Z5Q6_DIPPU|nr:hypothetical protein L9F63_025984 [Diploptera punctata]
MLLSPGSVLIFTFVILHTVLEDVSGARILVIMPSVIKTHFITVEPYLKALAARGHHVVVVSHYPQKEQIPNYTDIVLESDSNIFGVRSTINLKNSTGSINPVTNVFQLNNFGMLTDLFHNDCFFAFGHKFKATIIGFSTCVLLPWANERIGNPDNPSYIPNLLMPYSDQMTFSQRLINTMTLTLFKLMYYFNVEIPSNKIIRHHFGEETPDISEIVKNTSLIFVNSHFSFGPARPLMPGVVEVAGIHIKPSRPLPSDIQEYLDGADHGRYSKRRDMETECMILYNFLQLFVAVGLGAAHGFSLLCDLKCSIRDLNAECLIAFFYPIWLLLLSVVIKASLPYRHPNVVAFISHGGQLSLIEAIHSGVPVVGIPFVGDQRTNVANLKERGMAVRLDFSSINKKNVLDALHKVLYNRSYIENAEESLASFGIDRSLHLTLPYSGLSTLSDMEEHST